MRKTNRLFLPALAIVTILAAFTILRVCLNSKNSLLPQPPSFTCQPTSCHGYDLQCGFSTPKACDLMYTSADTCRSFASCQVKNGRCLQVNTPQFDSCKICMEQCNLKMEDSIDGITCEEKCLQKLLPTT